MHHHHRWFAYRSTGQSCHDNYPIMKRALQPDCYYYSGPIHQRLKNATLNCNGWWWFQLEGSWWNIYKRPKMILKLAIQTFDISSSEWWLGIRKEVEVGGVCGPIKINKVVSHSSTTTQFTPCSIIILLLCYQAHLAVLQSVVPFVMTPARINNKNSNIILWTVLIRVVDLKPTTGQEIVPPSWDSTISHSVSHFDTMSNKFATQSKHCIGWRGSVVVQCTEALSGLTTIGCPSGTESSVGNICWHFSGTRGLEHGIHDH